MQKSKRVESFYFPVTPVAKGRPRFSKFGGAYTPKKTRDAEKELRDLAVLCKCKPFENAICVTISFSMPRPKSVTRRYHTIKPDADNIVKGVCDALNGVLYTDDAQIIELHVKKFYTDAANPVGICLTIEEVE
jgi:Holliday junction resolvase RusA-like endonuclease